MQTSATLLEHFRQSYRKDIDLSLRPAYRALLEKLGSPHKRLPPVFHVAGTNGKGSTCAFLRAILEAAGYKVHVYTSPHLVSFHERIRVAGRLIDEATLTGILTECENLAEPGGVSYFEAATAAAFTAFARTPADFTILEVGLGGRLDATNVIERPHASLIARLSYDHREYLGDTLGKIATEKAGIMKTGVPCFIGAHNSEESIVALRRVAAEKRTPLVIGGQDWDAIPTLHGFRFRHGSHIFDLPVPSLLGQHQYDNAALAIAALSTLTKPLATQHYITGVSSAVWPARLQNITQGKLKSLLPEGWELWLDGGHNDSAGEVLAAQIKEWNAKETRPLHVVCGMLTTKKPEEFLRPIAPLCASLHTVDVPNEPLGFTAENLVEHVRASGIANVRASTNVQTALRDIVTREKTGRILICGSLYLAGHVLHENGSEII